MDEFDVIDIQPELRLIVNALAKAIGPDTRSYLTGSNMDTNNAIILLRGILSTQTFGIWWSPSMIISN